MPNLATNYLGLDLNSPIIAASSGLTDSIEKLIELEVHGAGAIVLKSLFEEEIIMEMDEKILAMTSRPYVYPETFDYMDEDPQEDTVRKYLRLIKEAKAAVSVPIIASINCVSAQKWTYFAREIEKAGADALEINLFVLPTDMNRTGDENEQIYYDVLKTVKDQVALPIALKISPYHSNLSNLIKRLDDMNVDGIVMFNRFYSPDFDINRFKRNQRTNFIGTRRLQEFLTMDRNHVGTGKMLHCRHNRNSHIRKHYKTPACRCRCRSIGLCTIQKRPRIHRCSIERNLCMDGRTWI